MYTGFFPEIFRRGGRSIDRHALDLTNVSDYVRNHERGLLDHVHNCITCSLGNLEGGGEGSPLLALCRKNPACTCIMQGKGQIHAPPITHNAK